MIKNYWFWSPLNDRKKIDSMSEMQLKTTIASTEEFLEVFCKHWCVNGLPLRTSDIQCRPSQQQLVSSQGSTALVFAVNWFSMQTDSNCSTHSNYSFEFIINEQGPLFVLLNVQHFIVPIINNNSIDKLPDSTSTVKV